jgi:uncharacterized protein
VTALLDVNALIALFDFKHTQHASARNWFANWKQPFATCPITELGFVRITSNPRYSNPFASADDALELIRAFRKHSQYRFLPDAISIAEASFGKHGIGSHKHSTDRYLLRLAMHFNASLATFDQAIQVNDADERAAILML